MISTLEKKDWPSGNFHASPIRDAHFHASAGEMFRFLMELF